jgi:biotin synthase-like enzyme
MSTQKDLIKDPRKARRSKASILAETLICKKLGWKIEFLSGGYESFTTKELVDLIRDVSKVYGEKLWLNIGALNEEELILFNPYIKGVSGAVECINPKLHDKLCPSKPLKEIETMFELCDKLGLKKAMTLIVGLGETIDDFNLLKKFINEQNIERVTVYRLKPQKNTPFTKGPASEYFVEWTKEIKKAFPKLELVVGSWLTHLDEIHLLLEAGAASITKFPSINQFNSKYAKQIESEAKKAGRVFEGTLTKMPKVDWDKEINKLDFDSELKTKIKDKLNSYLKKMS